MRKVLVDASSAILLFKAGLIGATAEAWELVITPSVMQELLVEGHPGTPVFRQMALAGRLTTSAPGKRPEIAFLRDLDRMGRGERDTLNLFLSGTGEFIIIDDGRAAGFCRTHEIPYINALLVPRILERAGADLPVIWSEAMDKVFRTGRYSDDIMDYAKFCPDHSLEAFMP